jgi:GST-like protein
VHFQHAAPDQIPYAINRYRREADRHYRVLDAHLRGRSYIAGDEYSIADMSAWGWIDRMKYVLSGAGDPLTTYPNLERWFQTIDGRAAVARARAVGRNISFKQEMDEEARRALFPSNYPLVALNARIPPS